MLVHVDLETYSDVDLKAFGAYRYAASPALRILLACWYEDGEHVATDQDHAAAVNRLIKYRSAGATFVAHNAAFERVVFTNALRNCLELEPDEWLSPEEWEDTMALAGELGYPQSLGKLAKALGAEEKDEAGTLLINWFCKPDRNGNRRLPEDHPEKWEKFVRYCEQDVAALVDVHARLLAKGGWPTPTEKAVFLADQRINDRGIAIDVPLAIKAVRVGRLNTEEQKRRFTELTGVENPKSVQQLGAWAKSEGLHYLHDMRKETIKRALDRDDLKPHVREALEIRQELALAAPAKFATALGSQVGGRLRGTLRFFGAHTGRWAGRGTQVQNLPRQSFRYEVDRDLAILDLLDGKMIPSEELKQLVRPLFIGPFTVVDYAAIEARVIAWLAGEQWALDAFNEGRDIYVETAERMGGLTRSQGKIAVLALGYNGGANSLRAMAGDRDYIRINPKTGKVVNEGSLAEAQDDGEDLPPARLIRSMDDDTLYDAFVYPWRHANSKIVRLWKTLDARFRTGGPVGKHLYFEADGPDRLLRLPSGRAICYRRVGVKTDPETGRQRLRFASPEGYWAETYGGRLAENATQAVARDIMAEALVRLEEAGKPVVAHVHDEILVEGKHDLDEIKKIMCVPPSWAAGLPIDGGGYRAHRYRKD